MRKKSWWLGLAALMALAGFMVGACTVDSGGSGGPDSEVPAVSAVTVTPASVVLAPKDTQQFTAKVEVTGDLATTVTWTVEGEGKNAGTTISDAGLLTVAEGEIVTPLTVRATSTADPAKSGTAKVTVSFYSVSKVTVDPKTAKVIRGDTQQFTAKVEVTGDLATTVTWTVEGAGKAGTTISDAGLLTVATDETAPSLTVKAASTVDSAKFDTATVTVDAGLVSKVTVSPKAPTLGAGGTQQFTAKVDVTGGLAQTVTWSVEGEGKQVGTTITDAGLLTLDKDETVTPLTVRATSTADPAKFDTATVTVNAALVSKVTVDPESIALAPGKTQQFTANLAVTWTVEGAGKAGTTITDAGLLTLDKDETVTPLTVRATSTADPAKSGTAEVTVSTGSVSKVTVDPKTPTVTRGTTLQFTGTVEATGGLPTTVTW
ncbi:MAG: hypothetical protein LBU25_00005, partial [Treponema sp.]|nr:hypothetical protein [Treponema sp.]